MLHELAIRDFAIIDQLQLRFGAGLNILTGETGAGKSIIIDAIGLLLGDRGATEWIRAGTERAEIEASFYLGDHDEVAGEVTRLLEEHGLDDPDAPEWLVLGREVRQNGRTVCRVNGRGVSLQILSEITGQLIDVHGQGEHLNLLRPRTHVHLLDRYAGLLELRQQVAGQVGALRKVRAELQRLRQDARSIAQRVDLLSFQSDEIARAALRAGEEEELENERRRLANAEALLQLAQAARIILSQGDGELPGALDLVGESIGKLERLARIDPSMQNAADDAQGLLEQLSDLAANLQDYADQLEFNPERLKEVEERIELLHTLKRKYGDTIEQIVEFGRRAQQELDSLANWEVKTSELEQQQEALRGQIGTLAAALSARRQAAGEQLARQVETELADLRMARARFAVAVNQTPDAEGVPLPDGRRVAFDSLGVDQVEFLISANPGEPLKPMVKVASGGETARLMLALKSVLAHADATPTLIFDEIDQGIGGRVGAIVGQKLWMLTGQLPSAASDGATVPHQVLCITHLPQLAAYGDKHYSVNKRVLTVEGEERTTTVVDDLADERRVDELASMLGAASAAGRQSVAEMMAEVDTYKRHPATMGES